MIQYDLLAHSRNEGKNIVYTQIALEHLKMNSNAYRNIKKIDTKIRLYIRYM